MKILDCTLRDGGYYTNWDFNEELVRSYFSSLNDLPVDYLEIGYRSKEMSGYLGEFFYCPVHVMEKIQEISSKPLAVMLNEKNVNSDLAGQLLGSCKNLITMVRIAVDPENFERSISLAEKIKSLGFEVCLNLMYMSKWTEKSSFLSKLPKIQGIIDYLYMVDSYGGICPKDIGPIFNLVKEKTSVKIGFHGHNNLELSLANTLAAIECGVDIVDATVMGMGRGAGNLETELFLTYLNAKEGLPIDFNVLTKLVEPFTLLQQKYGWGSSLPYMVSGANSLPQKEVMEWVGKRYFSFNSIIRTLTNKTVGLKDNIQLTPFKAEKRAQTVLIIGGGGAVKTHVTAIKKLLKKRTDIVLIHASSKNACCFADIPNNQIHCLSGNEGYRLESNLRVLDVKDRIAVLPPYPRTMGTYIPTAFSGKAFQLEEIAFSDKYLESITSVVIQTALDMGAKELFFVGYDGYSDQINELEIELFNENQYLFSKLSSCGVESCSLTPTLYGNLKSKSIYAIL